MPASTYPAPNVEPGDVVMLTDGREALVTARVEGRPVRFEALLQMIVSTSTPDAP